MQLIEDFIVAEKSEMDVEEQEKLSYMERNGSWIKAALGCLILATLPLIMPILGPGNEAQASAVESLSGVGMVLGIISLGYGLATAGTASARIFLLILIGLVSSSAFIFFISWWRALQ